MADSPQLVEHQRLNLTIVSGQGVHALRTQVHGQATAGERLVVLWPMDQLRLFPVRAGQLVIIEHSRPGDAHYTREMFLEAASTEEPPTLVLTPHGEWQRVQRRQAPRIEVTPRPVSAQHVISDGTRHAFDARPTDLSVGGVRFVSSLQLAVNDDVFLTFGGLDASLRITVHVSVVRVQRAATEWDIACRFVESDVGVRDALLELLLVVIRTGRD
ncbi:MAG: hypothetical protein NVSMB2_24030 [Chloroflexota bacterium]